MYGSLPEDLVMKRIMTLVAASLCVGALVYGCSSSSSGNHAGGGTDGGSDGSTADVSHKEAAPQGDDSGDDSSGSTCPTPADLSSWKPPAYVPAKAVPGACAPSDIAGYDAACISLSTMSQSACMAFQTSHATCNACINSKSTDSSWGALISYGGVSNINLGGCLQLAAPSETACALALEVAAACPHAACDTVCPVTAGNAASFTQWTDCEMTADADACGTYETASNCLTTDSAAMSTICNPPAGATFESLFLQFAQLFCGSADAGATDAASDAPGD
jgi:hypothetical protein